MEDLEIDRGRRNGARVDAEIERLGLSFQIATRLTSWVAISEEPSVDPGQPTRRERIPHELAHGISAEGLGLSRAFGFVEDQAAMLDVRGRGLTDNLRKMVATFSPREAQILRTTLGDKRRGAPRSRSYGDLEDLVLGASSPERPVIRLVGRVGVRSGAKLVIEIELPEPLAWEPGDKVSLVLSGGQTLEAIVDRARSTRAGECAPGQTLRLALEVTRELAVGEPREIRLESAGIQLCIAVEA